MHQKFIACILRFRHHRKGVAAVEFALIVPIILMLYLGTMELSSGLETSRKVSRTASMVADIIAQQSSVNTTEMKDILNIAQSTVAPYKADTPMITVTAIKVDDTAGANPTARIAWSFRKVGTTTSIPYVKNNTITIPAAFRTRNAFYVKVETKLAYLPLVTWVLQDNVTTNKGTISKGIPLADTYYLRPRLVENIPCSDCG